MPVDVRIGKMLIYATLLDCLEPCLTIAAMLSAKSPFLAPPDKREEARRAHQKFLRYRPLSTAASNGISPAESSAIRPPPPPADRDEDNEDDPYPDGDNIIHCRSDHLAVVHAYDLWHRIFTHEGNNVAFKFCRDHHLSMSTLQDIDALRDYYRDYLLQSGFISHSQHKHTKASHHNNKSNHPTTPTPPSSGSFHELRTKSHSNILIEDTIDNIFNRDLVRCAVCAGKCGTSIYIYMKLLNYD